MIFYRFECSKLAVGHHKVYMIKEENAHLGEPRKEYARRVAFRSPSGERAEGARLAFGAMTFTVQDKFWESLL